MSFGIFSRLPATDSRYWNRLAVPTPTVWLRMRPSLETPRLLLRPLCPSDASWLAELNRDTEVMRFIPGGPRPPDEAAREAQDQIFLDQHSPHLGYWAIEERANAGVHGWAALKKLNIDDIEVGYRLLRPAWSRGIATEAAARLLDYGFLTLELDRIVAVTFPENIASRRVIEKLGLRLEKSYSRDGHDWLYFAIARSEWNGRSKTVEEPANS